MTLEGLQALAESFPAVTTDIKWEHHLCFNVGDKMFLITSPDEVPVNASLKVANETFERLITQPGITPAPYLARYKWVRLEDISLFTAGEWEKYISEAYHLIASKLPAKKRKELGI